MEEEQDLIKLKATYTRDRMLKITDQGGRCFEELDTRFELYGQKRKSGLHSVNLEIDPADGMVADLTFRVQVELEP